MRRPGVMGTEQNRNRNLRDNRLIIETIHYTLSRQRARIGQSPPFGAAIGSNVAQNLANQSNKKKSRVFIRVSITFRIPGTILAASSVSVLALSLSACMSLGQPGSEPPATLADLKRRTLVIEQQALDPVAPEQVLDTYRQAIGLFSSSGERSAALRRMADLTMVATEDHLINTSETPDVQADASATDANSTARIRQDAGSNLQYGKAIALYTSVIAAAPKGSNLAEEYYLLAKAYDLDGQPDKALDALNTLVNQYPDSPFSAEAQFRRGEHLFLRGDYDESAAAYAAIINIGPASEYYEHALYKHGWSLYKLGDYDLAVNDFVALLDIYMPTPPPKTPEQLKAENKDRALPKIEAIPLPEVSGTRRKLMDDTLRVLSMSFANLEGADSVWQHFSQHGSRIYEHEVYESLGELYLAQERYKDAADTYAMFAKRNPLHAMAPAMSSREIATYQKGGFPSLVLPAKENFVKQYGVYSTYWERATPEARQQYSADLKLHLVELANHYHALAQTSQKRDDYLTAARWYREFLATWPDDETAPGMNMLLGEVLFAAKDFPAAIEEFERTAWEYPTHPGAEKAAYFALLAHQENIKQVRKDDPLYRGLIAKRASSSLRFAKEWPGNANTPEILDGVIEDELTLGDMNGVIAATQLLINLVPPAPQPLREKAWITYANAIYDKAQYKDAEVAYSKVLGFTSLAAKDRATFEERLATSVYKQGEALEKAGSLNEAAAEYLRVGVVAPDAVVRANAEYDAANILLQQKQYDKAIPVLEKFRSRFPGHELTKTVPAKLSLAYEETGNLGAASTELVAIATLNKGSDPELARQALWQAADMKEKTGDNGAALKLYEQYEKDYPNPVGPRMEAQYKAALLNGKAGNTSQRLAYLDKLVQTHQRAGSEASERTRYLAAWASMQAAETQFQTFSGIRLTQPLKLSIARKKDAMQKASDAYTNTVKLGVLEFTTGANYKLGELYRQFGEAILQSERPRGLDDVALEEYEILLEDQALPFEDKAIAIFQTNAERTKDGVWDEWMQKTYESLRKLNPGRYGKTEQAEESVDVIY